MTITLRLIDANNRLRRGFERGEMVSSMIPFYSPTELRVFVFDGRDAKKYRLGLYPGYKGRRDTTTPQVNGAYDFLETVRVELIPHVQNALVLKAMGWEADDLIAYYAQRNKPVIIDSNDGDFWSLVREGVTMTDPPKFSAWVQPEETRLYKTLVGDSSDNIPGLYRFGELAWQGLSLSAKNQLYNFLDGYGQLINPVRQVESFDFLGKAQLTWLKENHQLMHTFWQVVGFFPVPHTTILENYLQSIPNPQGYAETLQRYFWS